MRTISLYISNSVLDNCLSTLKHETMYYPSRIRRLIDSQPDDVDSLKELVDYYKSLYSLLSAQAMEQVEGNIKADDFLNRYLVSLMRGNSKDYHTGVAEIPGSAYVRYWIDQQDVAYDAALHAQALHPSDGRFALSPVPADCEGTGRDYQSARLRHQGLPER